MYINAQEPGEWLTFRIYGIRLNENSFVFFLLFFSLSIFFFQKKETQLNSLLNGAILSVCPSPGGSDTILLAFDPNTNQIIFTSFCFIFFDEREKKKENREREWEERIVKIYMTNWIWIEEDRHLDDSNSEKTNWDQYSINPVFLLFFFFFVQKKILFCGEIWFFFFLFSQYRKNRPFKFIFGGLPIFHSRKRILFWSNPFNSVVCRG